MVAPFIIYMLLMSKLGFGLTWIDWLLLFTFSSLSFLRFCTEVALANKNIDTLNTNEYKNKDKKTNFISKIT